MPTISVVIPTRNRADLLACCLSALRDQTLDPALFEVIVVDNGSTDRTADVCAAFEATLPAFRRIADERPGLLTGRHAGLRAAQGDVIAYFDDDAEPGPSHLATLARMFGDPMMGLVGGPCLPAFDAEPPCWFEDFVRPVVGGGWVAPVFSLSDLGDQPRVANPDHVFGCNFSVRKGALVAAGGFHPDSVPWELMRWCGDGETGLGRKLAALGLKTLYHPDCAIRHRVTRERMTLDYVYRRYFYDGVVLSYSRSRALGRPMDAAELTVFLADSPLTRIADGLEDQRRAAAERRAGGVEDGVRFHQRELVNDPDLLAWVLRPDYLDVPAVAPAGEGEADG